MKYLQIAINQSILTIYRLSIMKLTTLLLFLSCHLAFAQESNILDRLQALNNNGKTWYNIDGYSVTKEDLKFSFDEKGIKQALKKYAIKEQARLKDENIKSNNLYFLTTNEVATTLEQKNSTYLIENPNHNITVIQFSKVGDTDRELEKELTNLIIEDKIPEENFADMHIKTINFGGRKIELGSRCYWTFLNTVQCPNLGEMNWSVHKDLLDAQHAVENQLAITKSRKGGKVMAEEWVDIEFESVPTKAKKITYDVTGITGALTRMSGGKTLTIYYVAEKVRDNYMSCVLSFWNNDAINPKTQLPPLLEEVMKLR